MLYARRRGINLNTVFSDALRSAATWNVTAANIRRHIARFLFLQNLNDLLIAEPAALYSSVPSRNRLYRNLATIQGGTSLRPQVAYLMVCRRGSFY
jgi:hypothetical protein